MWVVMVWDEKEFPVLGARGALFMKRTRGVDFVFSIDGNGLALADF